MKPAPFEYAAPGSVAEAVSVLAEHGETVGRDVSQIERSVAWPGADTAQDFVDAGATLFTVGVNGPDYDLTELTGAISWARSHRD